MYRKDTEPVQQSLFTQTVFTESMSLCSFGAHSCVETKTIIYETFLHSTILVTRLGKNYINVGESKCCEYKGGL